jgi:hypothetical protein
MRVPLTKYTNTEPQVDYKSRPSKTISFSLLLLLFTSTSGSLQCEFVRLIFLQAHRETDRFFTTSGVQLAQSNRVQFHYRNNLRNLHVS